MNIENNNLDINNDIFLKNIDLENTIEFNCNDFDNKEIDIDKIELENTLNLGGKEYGE